MKKYISLAFILAFWGLSCNNNQGSKVIDEQAKTQIQPNNDHLIMATLWVQKSAEYRALTLQTYRLAKIALLENLKNKQSDKPAAVVLDVDETLLDNSPFQVKMMAENFAFSSEKWKQWTTQAQAKPIAGAIDFLNFAKQHGVEVFYVSNRQTDELDATIENMKNFRFPNLEKSFFLFKTQTSDKTPRRNKVAETHEIILFVGDNLTDFSQDFAQRGADFGSQLVDSLQNQFGSKFIVLPNPMYGEWEKALYQNSHQWSLQQKDSFRRALLKPVY